MPTKSMIGQRVRNRSGSVDSSAIVKRIEQRAIQHRRRRIHKRFNTMKFENLIELYSPTPEEERERMRSTAIRLLPERLADLGAFPETLKSLDDVSVYGRYNDEGTFFFDVSYYDTKYKTYISLPMVKVVMVKDEETDEYVMVSDPTFLSDTETVRSDIDVVGGRTGWDSKSVAMMLKRKKTSSVEGKGSKFTEKLPGTRVNVLFPKK